MKQSFNCAATDCDCDTGGCALDSERPKLCATALGGGRGSCPEKKVSLTIMSSNVARTQGRFERENDRTTEMAGSDTFLNVHPIRWVPPEKKCFVDLTTC